MVRLTIKASASDSSVRHPAGHAMRPVKVLNVNTSTYSSAGLEKLTNAKWSVSTVNDQLFPVELREIADWKSRSEYMLSSNFGKKN